MARNNIHQINANYCDDQAKQDIAAIVASDDGRLFLTDHAKERMLQRNITISHVRQVLTCRHNEVTESVHLNDNNEWKLTIEGFACGQKIRLPVVLVNPPNTGVLVVTAIGI